MKKALIRFPSIEAFKSVVYNVNRHAEFEGMAEDGSPIMNKNNPRPTIDFVGTVKLHGTNAGIGFDDKELWAQSKKDIITPQKDNQGFAFFVESNKDYLRALAERVIDVEAHGVKAGEHVAIYGEWCGKGIQKGVAINELEKMFVIFKVKIRTADEDGNTWVDYDYKKLILPEMREKRIFFIQEFPTFNITIDFNKPEESQNKLVEFTTEVEKQCPVGHALGAEGTGEGIVWTGTNDGNSYVFKVKGDKHSASKVKTLASVDPEKLSSISEFVDYAVTENRLTQAFEEVFTVPNVEVSKKGLGNLIKWMMKDLVKEEMDSLVASKLEPKDVAKAVSTKTVRWFMANNPGV